MPNNRVFYAIHSVAIKENGTTPTNKVAPIAAGVDVIPSGRWEVPRGVQSVGMTTTFNFEQVFQLGQVELFEFVELEPEIEFTIERVLDGTKPLWFMTTGPRTGANDLIARTSNYRVDIAVPIYPDTQTRATGDPLSMVVGSGMFLSSISYTFPVDGNFTESVTLVGNDKIWADFEGGDPLPITAGSGGDTIQDGGSTQSQLGYPSGIGTTYLGDAVVGAGAFITAENARVIGSGVQRRESFDKVNSRLPTEIPGVSSSGTLEGILEHIQTITVSTDLGREDIFELGSKRPFFKFVSFPVEITTAIEVLTSTGDLVDAISFEAVDCVVAQNTADQQITLKLCEGLKIDLGALNRLQSVDVGGGEAGGDNMTVTYNYTTFNELTITHDTFG